MWFRSVDQEDTLEQSMATHCSILAWRIPWTEKAWPATVHGVTKNRTRLKRLSTHTCDPGKTLKVDTVPAFMEKS